MATLGKLRTDTRILTEQLTETVRDMFGREIHLVGKLQNAREAQLQIVCDEVEFPSQRADVVAAFDKLKNDGLFKNNWVVERNMYSLGRQQPEAKLSA